MFKHLRKMCATIALSLIFRTASFSQAVTGTVLGTVTDTSGAVVTNVKVTLTVVNTNVTRASETNASGNFTFPNVPKGITRSM